MYIVIMVGIGTVMERLILILLIILNFYYHFLNAKTLTCLKKE